jgi:hypothetical protein
MSTGHTVNGKHTDVGHEVHFTNHDGKKHKVKITHLHNGAGTANLEGTVDGQLKQFTSVPHSPNASTYSWNHIEDDED